MAAPAPAAAPLRRCTGAHARTRRADTLTLLCSGCPSHARTASSPQPFFSSAGATPPRRSWPASQACATDAHTAPTRLPPPRPTTAGEPRRTAGELNIISPQMIKNEDLEELRELGSGTSGTVYHGKWRGTDVAIKRIRNSFFTGQSSELERLAHEFCGEAEILSKLHHPNVVAFYGVVNDGPGSTLATVTEFMVNGSLRHVLQRKDKYLDRRKRLIIAMDAAFGLEYLHSKNIVHFDLKCDNLLVNLKDQSRPICKVGGFGMSIVKRNNLVSGGVRGTLPWMAPELLNGSSNKVSEKVKT
ncbi:hypothetical protein BAE44_0009475, partial [Dichanthelium oligosanthes]